MAEETAAAKPHSKSGGSRPDFATLAGLVIAIGGIAAGLVLEGGSVKDVAQITAAIIVLGGTIGAVMITSPVSVCLGAVKKLSLVFFDRKVSTQAYVNEILEYAARARKGGIVSLERDLKEIENPFLKKALSLAVDGTDIKDLREMMEMEIDAEEEEGLAHAKVYEAAGGYAPTVGIIGAVLGLIQVMKHLENIEEVGKGIAVAFVATVYGVGIANLFFLPAAAKIKARIKESSRASELILEGVCSVAEGMNPKLIARKLEPFVREKQPAKKAKAAGAVAAQAA
jgi:chemotaxis protein MotA